MRNAVLAFIVGTALWGGFPLLLGAAEPWDHPDFWYAYLLAIGCAMLIAWTGRGRGRGWIAGLVVIWTMLPVILIIAGVGPLLPVGAGYLLVLSLPAAGMAEIVARTRRKRTSEAFADRD